MMIALRQNSHNTPTVRTGTAASSEITQILAKRIAVIEQAIHELMKKREAFADRLHTAHHLQTYHSSAHQMINAH